MRHLEPSQDRFVQDMLRFLIGIGWYENQNRLKISDRPPVVGQVGGRFFRTYIRSLRAAGGGKLQGLNLPMS